MKATMLLQTAAVVALAGFPVRSFPAPAPPQTLTFPEYFPLVPATVYVYQFTDTDGNTVTAEAEIGQPIHSSEFDGAVTPLEGLSTGGLVAAVAYYSSDSRLGFRYHGLEDPDCLGKFVPAYRIPSGMKPGEFFDQVTRGVATARDPRNGADCGGPVTETTRTTFAGMETVTVPAGTFQNCARIVIAGTVVDAGDTETESHLIEFAPGIGIVREMDPDPDCGYVIELVSVQ